MLNVLGDAHSAGRLDVSELDERQSGAMEAKFLDELPALIEDLPEGTALAQRLHAMVTGPEGRGSTLPATASPSDLVNSSGTRGENNLPALPGGGRPQTSIAVMSGRNLVVSPGTPEVTCFALWGGDDIYLRDVLGPGVQVSVHMYSLMAGNDIFVPPGVAVIDETVNILAGNTIKSAAQGDGSNGTLVLKGVSVMAGHDVKLDKNAPPPSLPAGPR